MKLDVVSYQALLDPTQKTAHDNLEAALLSKGIVGISGVPDFLKITRAYIQAARQFSALPQDIKQRYQPNRDQGDTTGYELGAEKFKSAEGIWHTDDKKASYYAAIPDNAQNKWPKEIDLQTHYVALGNLIFNTGKIVLNVMRLNETVGLFHDSLTSQSRMLHYHKENDMTNANPYWCGAHADHSIFTGLVPAYYFRQGQEVMEPEEAGLYIKPSNGHDFEKIDASDKSLLLFQAGEFGQLISHDRIKATRHSVKKANGDIERFTFALFFAPDPTHSVKSQSELIRDARYVNYQSADGSMIYSAWNEASLAQYRVKEY